MLNLLLVAAAVFCAFQVMRAERLLLATLWLAATSALLAILLYALDAPEVAAIELSVGAGLVTVLFVFAFSIIGEHTLDPRTIVPRPLVWGLILLVSVLLGWYILPITGREAVNEPPFAAVLWQERGLDILAQIVLIFAGVMGLMGMLAETLSSHEKGSFHNPLEAEAELTIPSESLPKNPRPQPESAAFQPEEEIQKL